MGRILASLALATALMQAQQPAAAPTPTAPAMQQQPQRQVPLIGPLSQIRPPDQATYKPPLNQTFHYDVEWRLFRAGVATLRLEQAGREYRVTGSADATGAVALLYHVSDQWEAFFDPTTHCSLSISKRVEEGFRRLQTNIRFDYGRRKAVLDERNLRKGNSKAQENDIPSCVTDVMSAIYYVGSLPLNKGDVYHFPLNDGGKTADVKLSVEEFEEVTTPAGTFKTVRVQPEATSGPVKDRGRIWVWYDQAGRYPVQIRARLFWGTLTFKLARIER